MSTLIWLKEYAGKVVKQYPLLYGDVHDFVEMAESEIQCGGSESHEVALAVRDIQNLVEGKNDDHDLP